MSDEVANLYFSSHVIRLIKSERVRCTVYIAYDGK